MNEFSYTQLHMGTTVSLSFICKDKQKADELASLTFAKIAQYEQKFSRFLPTSELSLLNQERSRIMSPEFIAVLKRSLELTKLTKLAFNPLVQVSSLGYTQSFKNLPSTNTISSNPYDTNPNNIEINFYTNRVTLGETQKLDFGGILKGYMAAMLADQIMSTHFECQGCIINIGGDLATRGVTDIHEPFIFFLYNPVTDREIEIPIRNYSLATSGTYARNWQTNVGKMHHVVDSESRKNPDIDGTSVSILCTDGAMSEALTKLFLTRGVHASTTIVPPEQYHYQYFYVSTKGDVQSNIV